MLTLYRPECTRCCNKGIKCGDFYHAVWRLQDRQNSLGLRLDLLFLIIRIGTLANELITEQGPPSPRQWKNLVIEVQFNLDTMIQGSPSPSECTNKDAPLLACNLAFLFTAQLLIERNCYCMRSDNVQDTVRNILAALNYVPPGYRSHAALLYPLFHAGLDAQGPLRTFILERLSAIGNRAMKAKRWLETLWDDSHLEAIKGSTDWALILVWIHVWRIRIVYVPIILP